MHDLNDSIPPGSGWLLETARGINDAGQIVGYGDHNGLVSAFLLTPGTVGAAGEMTTRDGGAAPPFEGGVSLRVLGPRPIRTDARVSYFLPHSGAASLRVLDVTGRSVRRADLAPSPTAGVWVWNLRDDGGRRVEPGVYFVRLTLGMDARVARLEVLR